MNLQCLVSCHAELVSASPSIGSVKDVVGDVETSSA